MKNNKNIIETRNLIKRILKEERVSKYTKNSELLVTSIEEYLNDYVSNGKRKIGKKSQNYGNFKETWCIDGKETIFAYYYYDKGNFKDGMLFVSKEITNTIEKYFSVRHSFTLLVIELWYDENMVPKFEEIVGESNLLIDSIDVMTNTEKCLPEPIKPEGITDDEMIDFIVKNTLYTKNEVMQKLESGERELEDFYLDIVGVVNRNNR